MEENAHLFCCYDYCCKGEENAMSIQLSISLLASDRPAALERCLDSLKPLMMRVPSELIVIATGTDERVRDTAARYTDRVIPFVWCDDFSAARNTGLKAARGEWFMFLDDDEWFEDTKEIEEFFLSGEYRNYGTAFYKVRNYFNWDGIRYFDFHAFRMAKRTSSISFQNAIHEELVPRVGASRFFDAYVHHYGYVPGITKADAGKKDGGKASRNIPMLLKAIRRNPDYIKNYIQLTQEYYGEGDLDKAGEYCQKARRMCRGKAGADGYIEWLQVRWADICCDKGNPEYAVKEIESILENEKPIELTRLCLYSKLLLLCTQLKEHEKTIHYGKEFEKLLDYMDNIPRLWMQQSYGNVTEGKVKKPETLSLGRLRCIEAALYLEDVGEAEYFLDRMSWEDESWMQRYYSLFDKWKGQFPALFGGILGKASRQNPYLLFQKACLMNTEEDNSRKEANDRQRMFLQCMEETASLYLKQQIIREAASAGMDLSGFARLIDLEAWKAYMLQIIKESPMDQLPGLQETARDLKETNCLHGLWLEKLILEKRLLREYLAGRELMRSLSEYVQCVLSYYKGQYREDLFSEERRNLLPEDCRFAVLVSEALACIEGRNPLEAVRLFRLALHFYPSMTGVIHEVIRLLKNNMNNPAPNAGAEFQALAGQMKNSLAVLIDQGQYAQAMPVMQQLCTLLPEDLELLRMRQRLLRLNER